MRSNAAVAARTPRRRALAGVGRVSDAEAQLELIAKAGAKPADVQAARETLLGRAAARKGDDAAAIPHFRKANELAGGPKDDRMQIDFAQALARTGQKEAALLVLKEAAVEHNFSLVLPAARAKLMADMGSAVSPAIPAPAAAAATPLAAIKPVLDAASRSIRLDPLGVSVAIPDQFAVRTFNAYDDFMGIAGESPQIANMSMDIRFVTGGSPPNCEAWYAGSELMSKKLKAPKKGAEFYDSRWYPKYYENKSGWVTLCMDRPGGFLFVESTPPGERSAEPDSSGGDGRRRLRDLRDRARGRVDQKGRLRLQPQTPAGR